MLRAESALVVPRIVAISRVFAHPVGERQQLRRRIAEREDQILGDERLAASDLDKPPPRAVAPHALRLGMHAPEYERGRRCAFGTCECILQVVAVPGPRQEVLGARVRVDAPRVGEELQGVGGVG